MPTTLETSRDDHGRKPLANHYAIDASSALDARPLWPLAGPLAMLVLAALMLGWPWLSGRFTIPWDAKATFLPQIQFLAQSLATGQSPFWAPYVFSGFPQVADPQAMIFSLPILLLSLFTSAPSAWALDVTVLSMIFAGAVALIVWFRDRGWHWAGALIAALAFGYGASMAWRIQHIGQVISLAYVPICMLCLDRALARRSLLYGVASGVLAASILLGRDQVALLAAYALSAFMLWRLLASENPWAAVRAGAVPLSTGAIVAAALIIVPLTLTVLLAGQSNRPFIDYVGAGKGSLHPALLLTSVAPELFGVSGRMEDYWGPPSFAWPDTGLFLAQNMGEVYIGSIPLMLIALGVLRGWLWSREIRFFSVAAAVSVLYALGWYTPVFRVLYELVPGVSLYRRPADATFLIGAFAAILAGYSAHRWFTEPSSHIARQHVAIIGGLAASVIVLCLVLGWHLDRLPNLVWPLTTALFSFVAGAGALAFACWRMGHQPILAVAILVGITVLDLGYNNGPNGSSALPAAVYDALEPATKNQTIALLKSKVVHTATRRDRIELAGLGFHWPNASLTHRLENTLGYNPIRLALYSAATGAEDHVSLPDQRKFVPLFPSYRSTLANLLGLRFIVTGAPIETMDRSLKPGDFRLIARTADGFVYENTRAMDRVLFATSAKSADFTTMLRSGVWPDADLTNTVLLESAPVGGSPKAAGQVRIVTYANTEITIEADSPDGGWVVLNDVWHPWWFVEVNGRAAELLRANVLFRAVAVPPGRHTVRFAFRPLAGAWAQLRGHTATVAHASAVHPRFRPDMASSEMARAPVSRFEPSVPPVSPNER